MKIVTADQMRDLERRSADQNVTVEMLMENAGLAVAQQAQELEPQLHGFPILVLVGPGNNGGDGLVAARHLDEWGARVEVYLCAPRKSGDKPFVDAEESSIPIFEARKDDGLRNLRRLLSSCELVIDAVLGTGASRPLEGAMKRALELVMEEKSRRPHLPVLALDVPSGLNADTGAVDAACPVADLTVTLGYPKVGLFMFPGAAHVGRLVTVDIGIPPELAEDVSTELLTDDWVRARLPARPLDAHKGTFGAVLVVAGSINYIGAAGLAASAAARIGAGLVTLAAPRSLVPIIASRVAEITYLPLPEAEPGVVDAAASHDVLARLADYKVLLMGCGLGQHPATVEFVNRTLDALPDDCPQRLVLDADALNSLARTPRWWTRVKPPAVLTPHPGEMARLSGATPAEVQSDRLQLARQAASQWKKTLVLKGAYTIVAGPRRETLLSPFANPALASAGSGDVLSGAIAGMMAQGLGPLDAATCGVYVHALAGEMLRAEMGDAGVLAGDLLPMLPRAIRRLKERHAAPRRSEEMPPH